MKVPSGVEHVDWGMTLDHSNPQVSVILLEGLCGHSNETRGLYIDVGFNSDNWILEFLANEIE